jgi:hypothetical protein
MDEPQEAGEKNEDRAKLGDLADVIFSHQSLGQCISYKTTNSVDHVVGWLGLGILVFVPAVLRDPIQQVLCAIQFDLFGLELREPLCICTVRRTGNNDPSGHVPCFRRSVDLLKYGDTDRSSRPVQALDRLFALSGKDNWIAPLVFQRKEVERSPLFPRTIKTFLCAATFC